MEHDVEFDVDTIYFMHIALDLQNVNWTVGKWGLFSFAANDTMILDKSFKKYLFPSAKEQLEVGEFIRIRVLDMTRNINSELDQMRITYPGNLKGYELQITIFNIRVPENPHGIRKYCLHVRDILRQELIPAMLHPERVSYYLDLWGYDLVSDEPWEMSG